jgi:protein phosphatase
VTIPLAGLRWGSATDVGLVREQNEDALWAGDGLFAVADGMGGRLAGEVASALAIEQLRDHARGGVGPTATLVEAVGGANQAIVESGSQSGARRGMATTLTGLSLVAGPRWAVFNVGDSRVYRWADHQLAQLTVDHSAVQEMVAAGFLDADEARTHPRRNVVTRALGAVPSPDVDVWELPITPGERFLVCSDGLTTELSDHEIAEALTSEADPQAAAEQLVALALQAGGHDNITVVVVDVAESA